VSALEGRKLKNAVKGEAPVIRVYIGWDSQQILPYHVLCHSIIRHTQSPVSIAPIKREFLNRPRHPNQSTEFAFTRFLVPSLCHYEGWALYLDCDMVVTEDIGKLWALRDERYAVMVVKREDHIPALGHAPWVRGGTKMGGRYQSRYPRKNWSSLMLFNNGQCRALTREAVESQDGSWLHRFQWVPDEKLGDLPSEWNHLVGVDAPDKHPRVANYHFTMGGPWLDSYGWYSSDLRAARVWREAEEGMKFVNQYLNGDAAL
jgi:Glycosyl transferase family 8